MDKGFGKRLKRGLEDLSPLFQSPPSATFEKPHSRSLSLDVQFLAVCVPDHEGDAFLANAYLASQIVRHSDLSASLISIVPGMNRFLGRALGSFPSLELLNPRLSRLILSHRELWGFIQEGGNGNETSPSSTKGNRSGLLLFLEFEPFHFRSLARIALLLDRVVFFVQHEVESLREAYRWIKVIWNFNREVEFFIVFRDHASTGAREEFLYQRFSLINSRFLGISPVWLGDLAFPEKDGGGKGPAGEVTRFNLNPLLAPEGLHRPLSPEKNRFWHHLREILERGKGHELHSPAA